MNARFARFCTFFFSSFSSTLWRVWTLLRACAAGGRGNFDESLLYLITEEESFFYVLPKTTDGSCLAPLALPEVEAYKTYNNVQQQQRVLQIREKVRRRPLRLPKHTDHPKSKQAPSLASCPPFSGRERQSPLSMPESRLPRALVDLGIRPEVRPVAVYPSASPLAVVLRPVSKLEDALAVSHSLAQVAGVPGSRSTAPHVAPVKDTQEIIVARGITEKSPSRETNCAGECTHKKRE